MTRRLAPVSAPSPWHRLLAAIAAVAALAVGSGAAQVAHLLLEETSDTAFGSACVSAAHLGDRGCDGDADDAGCGTTNDGHRGAHDPRHCDLCLTLFFATSVHAAPAPALALVATIVGTTLSTHESALAPSPLRALAARPPPVA
ncbi:MAG: hypothetical protein U0572_14475 [Phycisphaerales bacterium]